LIQRNCAARHCRYVEAGWRDRGYSRLVDGPAWPAPQNGFQGEPAMANIEWSEKYSVGIPLIDRHHRMLIAFINGLGETVASGGDVEKVGRILDELVTYTKMHFSYEEALFDQYGYPGQVEHRDYHRRLVSKVQDFVNRYKSGTADLGNELLDFLKQWLNHHILEDDMAYSAFLREKMGR
jgi:hemerythrin-like metal-binding protein